MAEIIDRISELPAHIIYDTLRKRWSSIWRWRPDVIISKYNHKSLKNNLENFTKSVDDSLLPYAEHNLRIETLCLYGLVHPGLTSHIDRWLNLAIEHNVTSLKIYSNSMKNLKYYSIPDALYAAKMLTELSLRRNLSIDNCKGIHNLCVAGLVNLEKLELLDCEGLEKVEIQAPNLRMVINVDPNIVHGNVDSSWYNNLQDFVQKLNYSMGLYESILIYEDPSEIIVPPTREIELRTHYQSFDA
ncbi:hypothetical protein KY289_018371 [Solanum tuberosum]|nr:hypothetical protein KY289_018371 [Solanum tuberosum]